MKQVRKQFAYPFKKLKVVLKRLMGWSKRPILQAYRGYLTEEGVYIHGRLLEDNGLAAPNPEDSWRKNSLAMLKRYFSTGIPGVLVHIDCLGHELDAVTDIDGYFEVVLPKPFMEEYENTFWSHYKVSIAPSEEICDQAEPVVGDLMHLNNDTEFGVISDIDDTLLISHSTDFFRKFFLLIRKNAYSRLPFAGAAPFYRALQKGQTGKANNPFFYISSSEWGLYDLLTDFCQLRQIPKGIFLLRTLPNSFRRYIKYQLGNHDHKLYKIREVLNAYPQLPFVLIGDSGQHDPEIYQKAVSEFPNRIRSIYIREVSSDKRTREVEKIVKHLAHKNVPMALVQHTKQAVEHAAQMGLIQTELLSEINYDPPSKYKNRTL